MENIFVEFLPPWVETGIQPAFYDKESGTVLQQTARMYARVNMLIRMFNKLSKQTKQEIETFEENVNETVTEFTENVTEIVNTYIEKFNELHDYVHDYFDNLDVQEEINHKLDEMVEDGTLQDVLLNYATVSKVYNTTREMISDSNTLVAGEKVKTLGYYEVNDGGGAEYLITPTAGSSYQIKFSDSLYATLIATDVNVDQLGAKGGNNALSHYFDSLEDAQKVYPNATDLTELVGGIAIQCTINYFHDHKISFYGGSYYLNTGIGTFDGINRIHLCGSSKWKTVIRWTDVPENENQILYLTADSSRNVIENLDFVGPYEGGTSDPDILGSYMTDGILMYHSSYNTVKNCVFRECRSGIKISYSWTNNFEDCYFARCHMGIGDGGGSALNDLTISHCFAEYNNYGIYLGEGRSQLVINCDIEHNNQYGLRKTNEGDIQVISSYFEDNILISYGQTYCRNVLISGCSFWQSSENTPFYSPIEFNGTDGVTQVTVMNCNFIDAYNNPNASSNPAIKRTNNNTGIPPTIINNTVTNMIEFDPSYMRGVHIKNGMVHSYYGRSMQYNGINADDGQTTTLPIYGKEYIRFNLASSGSHTVKFPTLALADRQINHEYKIVIPANNPGNRAGTISLAPDNASTCEVTGHTTITISDKDKLITVLYVGEWDSKSHWSASITA